MEHTSSCLELQQRAKLARDAFLAKYPNACQVCNASGVVTWQENQSPIGSGYIWMETLSDPCESCYGTCPRCRSEFDEPEQSYSNEYACRACGWQWGKGKDDLLPPTDYECDCWMKEA